jgi:hypothetical protein
VCMLLPAVAVAARALAQLPLAMFLGVVGQCSPLGVCCLVQSTQCTRASGAVTTNPTLHTSRTYVASTPELLPDRREYCPANWAKEGPPGAQRPRKGIGATSRQQIDPGPAPARFP